jgi:hypothetical protein
MSNPNPRASDRATLAAVLDPVSQEPGTVSTGWVRMGAIPHVPAYETLQAIVAVGAIAGGGTVAAKLEQATDGAGAGAKDLPGKAIAPLTAAAGDSNTQAVINCKAEELDVNGAYAYTRLTLTVGGAASLVWGAILGHNAGYAPTTPATSVTQVVG